MTDEDQARVSDYIEKKKTQKVKKIAPAVTKRKKAA